MKLHEIIEEMQKQQRDFRITRPDFDAKIFWELSPRTDSIYQKNEDNDEIVIPVAISIDDIVRNDWQEYQLKYRTEPLSLRVIEEGKYLKFKTNSLITPFVLRLDTDNWYYFTLQAWKPIVNSNYLEKAYNESI